MNILRFRTFNKGMLPNMMGPIGFSIMSHLMMALCLIFFNDRKLWVVPGEGAISQIEIVEADSIKHIKKRPNLSRAVKLASTSLVDGDKKDALIRAPLDDSKKSQDSIENQMSEVGSVFPVAGIQSDIVSAEVLVHGKSTKETFYGPSPVYPEVSRRRGEQGEVRIRLVFQKQSQEPQITFMTRSFFAALNEEAKKTALLWRQELSQNEVLNAEREAILVFRFYL